MSSDAGADALSSSKQMLAMALELHDDSHFDGVASGVTDAQVRAIEGCLQPSAQKEQMPELQCEDPQDGALESAPEARAPGGTLKDANATMPGQALSEAPNEAAQGAKKGAPEDVTDDGLGGVPKATPELPDRESEGVLTVQDLAPDMSHEAMKTPIKMGRLNAKGTRGQRKAHATMMSVPASRAKAEPQPPRWLQEFLPLGPVEMQ